LDGDAKKQYKRLNEPMLSRIDDAIDGLEKEPPEGDIKPLKGFPEISRVRVGNYCVLFFDEGDIRYVFRIAPQGEV